MADQTGIEPAIFSVTGRHVNRYTTGPQFLIIIKKIQINKKKTNNHVILANCKENQLISFLIMRF